MEIEAPRECLPFCDTFGRSEWEELAARIVAKSQKAEKWVATNDYDTEMQIEGLLQSVSEGVT